MKRRLHIYTVRFEAMYSVGNALVIAAHSKTEATKIAGETILHTDKFEVHKVKLDKPEVIIYLSGEY